MWAPRRNPRRHRGGSSWLRSSTLRPPRRHASRPWQPDGDPGRRRYTPALPGAQGVTLPHAPALLCCAPMSPDLVSDWGPASAALTEHGFAVLPGAMPDLGWGRLRAEAEHLLAD